MHYIFQYLSNDAFKKAMAFIQIQILVRKLRNSTKNKTNLFILYYIILYYIYIHYLHIVLKLSFLSILLDILLLLDFSGGLLHGTNLVRLGISGQCAVK